MFEKIAKCPYCGCELTGDETYETSIDISIAMEYVAGHCDNCGREFQWENIYNYSHVSCLREV